MSRDFTVHKKVHVFNIITEKNVDCRRLKSTVVVRYSGITVWWIRPQPDPVGNYIIQNRRARAVPLHLVPVGAIGHSFSFTCQLRCLLSSGRCAADTSSVSGCRFVFKAPIISMLNIITHAVNMRTDLIKNTLLSPGLRNPPVMRCPPSYWLWVGCGAFIQCDRGEPGTRFPGTPVPHHTDTLLWSATLILIKCCLTRRPGLFK